MSLQKHLKQFMEGQDAAKDKEKNEFDNPYDEDFEPGEFEAWKEGFESSRGFGDAIEGMFGS